VQAVIDSLGFDAVTAERVVALARASVGPGGDVLRFLSAVRHTAMGNEDDDGAPGRGWGGLRISIKHHGPRYHLDRIIIIILIIIIIIIIVIIIISSSSSSIVLTIVHWRQ
jgi:hypothetical protein